MGFIVVILMDFSKTYDCLPRDHIIAKFEAYGLSKSSLELLLDYIEGRKHHVKIGSSYSFWSDVKRSVLKGSILGPLHFNVFINNLFMFMRTVKSVILTMTSRFVVEKWNYRAF